MGRTIAAIATPIGEGGVSMIRLSGEASYEIAEKVFAPISGKKISQMKGYTAAYGSFLDANEEEIDTGVALAFRAPYSYTGENVVELMCHGGMYVTNTILDLVLEKGASLAEPGEFTKLAFLNGKMSLTQAESVMDLISARSKQALKLAETASKGVLFGKIKAVTDELVDLSGYFGAWFDYPDEDIDEISPQEIKTSFGVAVAELEKLISTYEQGRLVREGIKTAIVGKPNVGKSTLMNFLAKAERSIVTDIPGTTRDVVEESIRLGEIILNLSDTAGIRDTQDSVEKIGVRLAKEKIHEAELVLMLLDAATGITPEDREIMEVLKEKISPKIAVLNKIDLVSQDESKAIIEELKKDFENIVLISAKEGSGGKALQKIIEDVLNLNNIVVYDPMIATRRQLLLAKNAVKYLKEATETLEISYMPDIISVNLEAAIGELLELTGERATEKTVDAVFSRFCVGK